MGGMKQFTGRFILKVSQHGTKHRIVYRVPGYNKPFKETFDSIEEANVRLAELELDKKTGVLSPPILLVRNRDKRNTMFSDFSSASTTR